MVSASPAAPAAAPRGNVRTLPDLIAREHARKRRRRWAWSIAAAVTVLVAGALAVALRPTPPPLDKQFRAVAAKRGPVVHEVHATGHVEALSTVQVGAEVSGRIARVEVEHNARVKAGQVLARFDAVALQAQLAQVKANHAVAEAALQQARADRDLAASVQARNARLHREKMLADAEREASDASARLAEARVRAAESQVAAQRAALELVKTNLDHTIIRAPIDGVVITRNVDPGQTVASALQTPLLFSVAADLTRMRVLAAVDEADIGLVREGQRAAFTVTAYGERAFDGVVTEVRSSPAIVQDVVTYTTVVEVPNPDLALKPGMTASVRIRTASREDALLVPVAALHFTPPGQEGGDRVWTVDGGALRAVPVRAGIGDGEWAEVEAPGLTAGTAVLVELTAEGRKAHGLAR